MRSPEIRPPAFLKGGQPKTPEPKPLGETLQHLTQDELARYGGDIVDVEATENQPNKPKQLPPSGH